MDEELIKTGDFAKMCSVTKKALYVYEAKGLLQPAAVEREIAELEKIKSSLVFFDQRISDLKQTGLNKVTIETCLEEHLEVSPFRHGVSLNPISFGPRYGVIVDDFEKAEISRFFKVVKRKEGNYVKAAGKYGSV